MKYRILFIYLFTVFYLGCSNPLTNKENPPFFGVWGAQLQTQAIKSVAFLNNGRYLENNSQVGLYEMITKISGGTTDWILRVDYNDGNSIQLLVVTTKNDLTIQISNETARGPSGVFDRLHSGDGL